MAELLFSVRSRFVVYHLGNLLGKRIGCHLLRIGNQTHDLVDHFWEPNINAPALCEPIPMPFWQKSHFEPVLLTSLPQHSGRSGKLDRSHPPPRA
jgi:hypothetical protein